MERLTLGFIGAGNMASAILNGVLSDGLFRAEDIWLSNRHEEKLAPFTARGVHTTTDNRAVAAGADVLVLAIKPQMFGDVLPEIADLTAEKCVVSIAAGLTCTFLRERLPGAHVVRAMPNTPLTVGLGATAVAAAPGVPERFFKLVMDLFSSAGAVEVIDESQMDDIINVNGSTPAFFFRMVDVIVKRAAEVGIDPDAALRLAAGTMEGSARLLLESGKTSEELIRQVCSPGGATLAALSAFDDLDFDGLLREAMSRCTKRARELGRS